MKLSSAQWTSLGLALLALCSVTIVLVTNLLAQARRIADRTLFLLQGEVVEQAATEDLFLRPRDPRTLDYIQGKFG